MGEDVSDNWQLLGRLGLVQAQVHGLLFRGDVLDQNHLHLLQSV